MIKKLNLLLNLEIINHSSYESEDLKILHFTSGYINLKNLYISKQ